MLLHPVFNHLDCISIDVLVEGDLEVVPRSGYFIFLILGRAATDCSCIGGYLTLSPASFPGWYRRHRLAERYFQFP